MYKIEYAWIFNEKATIYMAMSEVHFVDIFVDRPLWRGQWLIPKSLLLLLSVKGVQQYIPTGAPKYSNSCMLTSMIVERGGAWEVQYVFFFHPLGKTIVGFW
jgi:hypothetical protein